MDRRSFESWLDAYGRAWEDRDPEAARLFTGDAAYYGTPFDEPARGREGISEYWAGATGSQRDIRFYSEILAIMEDRGIARWNVTFMRLSSNTPVELDGIFLVELDGDGFCTEFREWWHSKK
ncbi:MAG: nuclear transport factor 2 family protein [Rubrobacter sp.]|nr:nuclear transport factor 2 family protein [Rubrobacter sp.]